MLNYGFKAHYAYRAVGEFARHLIPDELLVSEPGTPPAVPTAPLLEVHDTSSPLPVRPDGSMPASNANLDVPRIQHSTSSSSGASRGDTFAEKVDEKLEAAKIHLNDTLGKTPTAVSPALTPPSQSRREATTTVDTQLVQAQRQTSTFVRQRISIRGVPRDLEPASSMPILSSPPSSIGIIKEGPVVRWLTGMQIYDKKYKRVAHKAIKTRTRNTSRANVMLERARAAGVLGSDDRMREGAGARRHKRALDILDLENETPPPSAICGRLDVVSERISLSPR